MNRILLCTDGSIFSQSSYQYGAWFAQRLAAAIDVLHVSDARGQAASEARNLSGSIGLGASETLLNELVSLEHEKAKLDHQRAKLVLQEAKKLLTQHGVETIKTIHETGFLVDCLHHFEAAADLIVLGKRGETAEFASGHLGANLERIIRSSHKPCIVTSRQFKPIEQILVAYDGSPSAKKMLEFLKTSPVFQGLAVHIVTVAKNGGDATASQQLEEARNSMQRVEVKATCAVIQGNPEIAISHYCTEHNISLLMMGAYGHSRIRHLVIGSTTAQILRSCHIPVLVYR
ncbi:universal stress protein [filamentous cyanobacterium LEGE 11480]|uniref:Universal stress protein n=1 Tax=Romeriopsis navalis LEGE 11480 TaxID=2777977 RepID=A0A928VJX8_9CYAN|nr:universal stress protein [Romeriopsis navalis]MBE9029108.1 universal stress protein [Romeriopsis navalis LEGE 11480]